MSPFRLALILFLTVALDLTVPGPGESQIPGEEWEEAAHVARSRRIPIQVREAATPGSTVVRDEPRALDRPDSPPAPRPVIVIVVSKQPPSVAEHAPSADDH